MCHRALYWRNCGVRELYVLSHESSDDEKKENIEEEDYDNIKK